MTLKLKIGWKGHNIGVMFKDSEDLNCFFYSLFIYLVSLSENLNTKDTEYCFIKA